MTVYKNKIFTDNSRGASVLEVLLAMAIVAMATPFVYSRIAQTNHMIHDIAVARRVMSSCDAALNFVRMNQDKWPENAQIRLDEAELDTISADAAAGFIDKYKVNGATITDVYLAFVASDTDLRSSQIARHIGGDAAVVGDDGVAYGNTWAVAAPDFLSGDLIYRISRDVAGTDMSRYLHRGTSGEDKLNVMERDLDMAGHHIYNVATLKGKSVRSRNAVTTFIDTGEVNANNIYFSSGANLDGEEAYFDDVRVSGDISGFRNMYADTFNGRGFTTQGRVVADRVTISKSVNVATDMVLKSDTARSIGGFTGISAGSVSVPYVSADEMIFANGFGLTVSGELLVSSTVPVKLGSWSFPSVKPPVLKSFKVSRARRPAMPNDTEFDDLMSSGWQQTQTPPIQEYIPTIQ